VGQPSIVEADLNRLDHQQAVLDLTDAYAADPMGSGRPLPEPVRASLIPGLRAQPTVELYLGPPSLTRAGGGEGGAIDAQQLESLKATGYVK